MNENICWCGVGFIGFVVFDKSIQFDNESVLLFIIEENDVKKFLTNKVKECLKSEKNPSAIHKMTQKYYKWKNNPHSHSRLENLIKESPVSCRELKHKLLLSESNLNKTSPIRNYFNGERRYLATLNKLTHPWLFWHRLKHMPEQSESLLS